MASQFSRRRSIDVPSLPTAAHSYTTEQLLHYNAAGVDPYLVQVAELIGSQFNLALQSQRTLANAFSSLPRAEFYSQRMGIGYSDRHIARILLDSDGGFTFLSILGCLGEYFAQDVVVAIIMTLVKSFPSMAIPEDYEPSDFQWKRLVHLCQGVLATSSFGALITRNHENLRVAVDHVSISQVVQGLIEMSNVSSGRTQKCLCERTGSDAFWFAAVAEYLFDLKVLVEDATGEVIYPQSGLDEKSAQVVIDMRKPRYMESFDHLPLSKAFPDLQNSYGPLHSHSFGIGRLPEPLSTGTAVTGGRVAWEQLFRSSFGRAFTDIDPTMVAEFTGGAAAMISSALQYDQTSSAEVFLPHASTIRGLSGYGLIETVTSWFPELRRMAPQMGKIARLPFQQARDKCDEISDQLEAICMCSTCGNASDMSTEFCKHTLVEFVLEMGLYIARTVVIPSLYPKRSGVIAFYNRMHAARLTYRKQKAPETEEFFKGLAAAFPTPRIMIASMCMLFTGTVPKDIKDTTLATCHEGITVSLNAGIPSSGVPDPDNEQVLIRQRAGVNVSTGSSHLYGRIGNHAYWVPAYKSEQDGTGSPLLSFSESLEMLRTQPKEVKQMVKPKMGDLEFSFIRAGKTDEDKATSMGWLIL